MQYKAALVLLCIYIVPFALGAYKLTSYSATANGFVRPSSPPLRHLIQAILIVWCIIFNIKRALR